MKYTHGLWLFLLAGAPLALAFGCGGDDDDEGASGGTSGSGGQTTGGSGGTGGGTGGSGGGIAGTGGGGGTTAADICPELIAAECPTIGQFISTEAECVAGLPMAAMLCATQMDALLECSGPDPDITCDPTTGLPTSEGCEDEWLDVWECVGELIGGGGAGGASPTGGAGGGSAGETPVGGAGGGSAGEAPVGGAAGVGGEPPAGGAGGESAGGAAGA